MQTIPSHQVRVLDGAGPGPYSIFLLCPTVLPRCRRVHGHYNQHSHLMQPLFVMLPAICNLHPHDLILLTIFWTPPSGSIELNNSFSSQVRLALSVGSWGLVARWLGSCQVEPCRAAAVRIVLVRVPQFWHLYQKKTATTAGAFSLRVKGLIFAWYEAVFSENCIQKERCRDFPKVSMWNWGSLCAK